MAALPATAPFASVVLRWRLAVAVALAVSLAGPLLDVGPSGAVAQAPDPGASLQLVPPVPAPPEWPASVQHVDLYELPGQPMDIVADSDRSGYISLDTGGILRYELPSEAGGDLGVRVVVDDVVQARGIAIRDHTLYLVELGPFPCSPDLRLCEAFDASTESPAAGELAILDAMRARVLAFDIGADGSLENRRTVVDDLPVVSSLHAVNALTLGPDGWLYVPVGGVDRLWWAPERVADHTLHPEWLGTVLRFDGSGSPPEIVATGLRNVYAVTFDDLGRMWGVDNDGDAQDAFRFEEVLQIKPGHRYGYPQEGTFGPKSMRDDFAIWISQTNGTGGLAWAPAAGLAPGLLVGDCGRVTMIAPDPARIATRWEEGLRPGAQPVIYAGLGGCVTGLEPNDGHEVLATVFTGGDHGTLARVILPRPDPDPSSGPATPRPRWQPPA